MLIDKYNTMINVPHKILLVFLSIILFTGCKDDDSDNDADDPKAENRLSLGTSAEGLLSDDTFKSMTVELVYAPNYRPKQESIDTFKDFILARVNKPDGVTFIETEITNQPNAPFTIEEIRNIEDLNRTQYTVGDDIAVYVFFSNGSSENDTSTSVTLGTAYQNTSMVVYERTLQQITLDEPDILPILESTTLHHEFGHLFGLVNIQEDDIHPGGDHEDLDHLKHCIIEECLMYFEANNVTRIMQLARSRAQVAELDPLCIADLQAKGGK